MAARTGKRQSEPHVTPLSGAGNDRPAGVRLYTLLVFSEITPSGTMRQINWENTNLAKEPLLPEERKFLDGAVAHLNHLFGGKCFTTEWQVVVNKTVADINMNPLATDRFQFCTAFRNHQQTGAKRAHPEVTIFITVTELRTSSGAVSPSPHRTNNPNIGPGTISGRPKSPSVGSPNAHASRPPPMETLPSGDDGTYGEILSQPLPDKTLRKMATVGSVPVPATRYATGPITRPPQVPYRDTTGGITAATRQLIISEGQEEISCSPRIPPKRNNLTSQSDQVFHFQRVESGDDNSSFGTPQPMPSPRENYVNVPPRTTPSPTTYSSLSPNIPQPSPQTTPTLPPHTVYMNLSAQGAYVNQGGTHQPGPDMGASIPEPEPPHYYNVAEQQPQPDPSLPARPVSSLPDPTFYMNVALPARNGGGPPMPVPYANWVQLQPGTKTETTPQPPPPLPPAHTRIEEPPQTWGITCGDAPPPTRPPPPPSRPPPPPPQAQDCPPDLPAYQNIAPVPPMRPPKRTSVTQQQQPPPPPPLPQPEPVLPTPHIPPPLRINPQAPLPPTRYSDTYTPSSVDGNLTPITPAPGRSYDNRPLPPVNTPPTSFSPYPTYTNQPPIAPIQQTYTQEKGLDRDALSNEIRTLEEKGTPIEDTYFFLPVPPMLNKSERRAQVDRLMAGAQEGSWLIRFNADKQLYVISVYYQGDTKHLWVPRSQNQYSLSGLMFNTMHQLLLHFLRHPISDEIAIPLGPPIKCQDPIDTDPSGYITI